VWPDRTALGGVAVNTDGWVIDTHTFAHVLSGMVYGVVPSDAATLSASAVVVVVLAVAALASLVPASARPAWNLCSCCGMSDPGDYRGKREPPTNASPIIALGQTLVAMQLAERGFLAKELNVGWKERSYNRYPTHLCKAVAGHIRCSCSK